MFEWFDDMVAEMNGQLNFGWMHDVEIADGAIKSSFPLEKLLNNSVYYPGAGFDGRPVQWLHRLFQSFVYVDYGVQREHLLGEIEDPRTQFRGYHLAGSREIEKRELVPQGWRPPQEILEFARFQYAPTEPVYGNAPFAEWLLFDRDSGLSGDHGPSRFSLLYICADGVATYHALYLSGRRHHTPAVVVVKDHGFGGNWTSFGDRNGPFRRLVTNSGQGPKPRFLCDHGPNTGMLCCWPTDYSRLRGTFGGRLVDIHGPEAALWESEPSTAVNFR